MTNTRRMTRRSALGLTLAASLGVPAAVALGQPAAAAPNRPASGARRTGAGPTEQAPTDQARVVSERRSGPRHLDVLIESTAVGRLTPVRILLPEGFDAAPGATWPVLYLMHGAGDDFTSWTRETPIEAFTADKGVLTVMPDAGRTGIVSDWWNCGRPGAPDYVTFQLDEVMDVLRREYGAGDARVVAGISTGGYGAMACAARRPGVFRAAACYSGIPDTMVPGIPAFISSIVARENVPPKHLWGSPVFQASIWRAHNPRHEAASLRGTPLYLSCGSGYGGDPGDNGDPWDAGLLEYTVWRSTRSFAARLDALGIPVTTNFYRGGSHTWRYWWREFLASWPLLAGGLGLPS
jgi:diacylglycerol O-acyltransferase / trehalose O-mycolyltransferase